MNKPLATLSDEEVRQIALLVETLEHSTFDFLQLELGDLKVTIGKGNAPPGKEAAASAPSASVAPTRPAPAVAEPKSPSIPETKASPGQDGTVAVVAPTIGRFYAKPEPGAAPFVSVGTEVKPDSTVALVEVMKVFTAVCAGVQGVVTEICVQDGQLVEYGQVLFRVRLAATASDPSLGGAKGSRKGVRS